MQSQDQSQRRSSLAYIENQIDIRGLSLSIESFRSALRQSATTAKGSYKIVLRYVTFDQRYIERY